MTCPPEPATDSLARPGGGERIHLGFLDGIRGLAAAYVVCYHLLGWKVTDLSTGARRAVAWAGFGHFAVTVFIVLSGFSLMLSVAASADGRLRGGAVNYVKRRATRILPGYLAALALSILVTLLTALWDAHWRWPGAAGLPADLSAGSVISHALLLHNVHPDWVLSINPALWSIATEWQIYFVFPLVLLPAWRAGGTAAAVVAGAALGCAPHVLLARGWNLDWACPWFAGLFAMGMAVAVHTCGRGRRRAAPGAWLAGAALAAGAYVAIRLSLPGEAHAWLRDLAGGAVGACAIGYLTAPRGAGRTRSAAARLLEARPLAVLGAMSYSLYLVHCVVLQLAEHAQANLGWGADAALAVRATVGVPAALALGYAFHRLFERPFLSPAVKAHASAAPAAVPGA